MCQTCRDLTDKITAARATGNVQKARVLEVILYGHQANTCAESVRPVVLWRDGTRWVVNTIVSRGL